MDWIYSIKDPLWETALGTILMLVVVIITTRLIGLRSFAKFTVFDFAFTVAVGSVVASTLTSSTSIVHGAVAIGSLLLLTAVFAFLQRRFKIVDSLVSNQPLLLMDGSEILHDNLAAARVSESQIMAKLREANVLDLSEVQAVVLETTGDISVLHGKDQQLAAKIMEGVRKTP